MTLAVVAAVAAVALVGFALVALDDRGGPPIVIEDPLAEATIVVAVEGAVASPGVYRLPAQARTHDALAAAGGPAAVADLAAVNLARRLRDEERLVVPTRPSADADAPVSTPGATAVGSAAAASSSPPPAAPGAPGAGRLVDLNAASAAELESLPGIGPTLAQRIVEHRASRGPFRSVDDLEAVSGISPRMVAELRPLVSVGP